MPSRNPNDLHPQLQPIYKQFADEMEAADIDYILTCTYRSGDEQNRLFAQGRTRPGAIVTRARAGQSAHNFTVNGKPAAKAFDIVIMVNGKPEWTGKHPNWKKAGEIGMRLGLNWYGRPGAPFREMPHFQLRG